MEFLIISTLLCLDIGLGVIYRFWDGMKPKPLTFLELFNFMYDQKEDIIKILEDNNREQSKQAFNNYINLKDEIRKKNEKDT